MSTSRSGLDRYSAGVPLAVLLIIVLDVFNIFPVIYSPKWTLLIVFIIIVGFVVVGRHIVIAPGVCGGRPTFKYTRIDVRHALRLLAGGRAIERVAKGYEIPVAAVKEALTLAAKAFDQKARTLADQP